MAGLPNTANPGFTSDPRCEYCGQVVENGECGGDGEGTCSFLGAINDFSRDHALAIQLRGVDGLNVGEWVDGWILGEVGVSWDEMGWDRAAHIAAIEGAF